MTSSPWNILSPHKFEHPSHWYYRLLEIYKYDFGAASNDITSTKNFIKIRSAFFELNANRRTSQVALLVIVGNHWKWRYRGGSSSHLTSSGIYHVGITDCTEMRSIFLELPPMASRPYQSSCILLATCISAMTWPWRIMGFGIIATENPPTSNVWACHVGVTDWKKLETTIWSCLQWHNIHDKSHKNPFIRFRVDMCVDRRKNKKKALRRSVANAPETTFV